MKHLFPLITLLLLAPQNASADPFAELDQAVEQLTQPDTEEFSLWYYQRMQEFSQWQEQHLAEWDAYRAEAMRQWGDTHIEQPDTLVSVSEQGDVKTTVDLEQQQIVVRFVQVAPENEPSPDATPNVTPDSPQTPTQPTTDGVVEVNSIRQAHTPHQQVIEKVNQALQANQQLWQQLHFTPPAVTLETKQVTIQPEVLPTAELQKVHQLIDQQSQQQLSQLDIQVEHAPAEVNQDFRDRLVAEQQQRIMATREQRKQQATRDFASARKEWQEQPKQVVEYRVAIPSGSMGKLAAAYREPVERHSQELQLPAALVMAIMHTESHFNPQAKSHIPAYGLMQVVPSSAGRDVNRLFHQRDKSMSPHQLYDPEFNIHTGIAYLSILQTRYLKGINNPQSSEYAIIAAYNTGAGNVAKAFNTRSTSKAVAAINQLTPEQVYQQLLANLPYPETQNYLKKVTSRKRLYQQ